MKTNAAAIKLNQHVSLATNDSGGTSIKAFAAVSAFVALIACDGGDLFPPDLTAEAISPDGQLVARSWCTDACDMPEARTVTVSPVGQPIKPDEMLPSDQVVARVYFDNQPNLELQWAGDRQLTIAGQCLTDRELRPLRSQQVHGVKLHFVRKPTYSRCWQESVRQGGAS